MASTSPLARDTIVVDRFGTRVGRVERVLTASGPFCDGLIVATRAGKRFVDAPEVRCIGDDEVELSITCADAEDPGLTTSYGVRAARHDRTELAEADRREVVDALKRAYVDDELTADELGDRIEGVYEAATLDQLQQLCP